MLTSKTLILGSYIAKVFNMLPGHRHVRTDLYKSYWIPVRLICIGFSIIEIIGPGFEARKAKPLYYPDLHISQILNFLPPAG